LHQYLKHNCKKKDTYEVFGKYRIRKQEDGFVVYNKDQRVNTFLSSRNALSYCIFEKYFKYEDSKLLERLDGRLQSKLFDIEVAHPYFNYISRQL